MRSPSWLKRLDGPYAIPNDPTHCRFNAIIDWKSWALWREMWPYLIVRPRIIKPAVFVWLWLKWRHHAEYLT